MIGVYPSIKFASHFLHIYPLSTGAKSTSLPSVRLGFPTIYDILFPKNVFSIFFFFFAKLFFLLFFDPLSIGSSQFHLYLLPSSPDRTLPFPHLNLPCLPFILFTLFPSISLTRCFFTILLSILIFLPSSFQTSFLTYLVNRMINTLPGGW